VGEVKAKHFLLCKYHKRSLHLPLLGFFSDGWLEFYDVNSEGNGRFLQSSLFFRNRKRCSFFGHHLFLFVGTSYLFSFILPHHQPSPFCPTRKCMHFSLVPSFFVYLPFYPGLMRKLPRMSESSRLLHFLSLFSMLFLLFYLSPCWQKLFLIYVVFWIDLFMFFCFVCLFG